MKTEPAMLAPRRLQRELNPYSKEDVRYVPTFEESVERLRAVNYDQVVQLYREYLGSQAGELTIVGDFDAGTCLPILKDALAGWKAAKPYARIKMPISTEPHSAQSQINTPDKANATYNAGLLFPLRDEDPAYPALLMGNFILGSGTLSSRLGDRIRQKEGLSYGVSSSMSVSSQDERASLTITAICNPQNMSRLEVAAQEELARLLQGGVTPEELDKAKQGYLQAQKVGLANDATLAGVLSNLRYLDRTMAWEAELDKKIESLTPQQVNDALQKHVDPKHLIVVTAGDFESKTAATP
jgi:zinc protease